MAAYEPGNAVALTSGDVLTARQPQCTADPQRPTIGAFPLACAGISDSPACLNRDPRARYPDARLRIPQADCVSIATPRATYLFESRAALMRDALAQLRRYAAYDHVSILL